MKRLLLMVVFLSGTILVTVAQKATRISPSMRVILADREGKLSIDAAKKEMALMQKNKKESQTFATEEVVIEDDYSDGFSFSTPSVVNGVKVVSCWIGMKDDDTSALEALGVKVQAKFNGVVTANVPVNVVEKVAALRNVTNVSVAKKMKKKTYRSRILTNVDDVIYNSTDAQTVGLLQAYNGQDVVLGVIDTGIDFGHPMLNGRAKKKYVYNTTAGKLQEYTGSNAYYSDETHGTHTSSIAGGADYTATAYVYTTGISYTTVNNANFGGMAPGADLVLCDLGEELTDANIAASIKYINDYADEVGKPCVINISLGSHYGPHDGTGYMADVCAQYTGPGKIILYSSGNEGEDNIYLYKNASPSSPSQTVLNSSTRSSNSVDVGIAISYARTPDVELAARYYVVNTSNNTILWTSKEITTDDYFLDEDGNIELYGMEISVNDVGSDGTTPLSKYFTAYNDDSEEYGYIGGYLSKDDRNGKWCLETLLYFLKPVNNNYQIAMSVYPKTGTCQIDSWPAVYLSFNSSSATVNGTNFSAGTNDCCITDESTYPSVIPIGAYCSSKYWYSTAYLIKRQQWTLNATYQDVCTFSSYQREGYGPLGTKMPWITAPGEVIIAAYNRSYNAAYYTYAYGTDRQLGAMAGTSMASPCAAGITALWLQADPTLTPEKVKEVMKETAISDSYTKGSNAYKFGQGKIDALAGIKYVIEHAHYPIINADPTELTFETKPDTPVRKTFNVSGMNLEDPITATLTDENGVFSLSQESISITEAEAGTDITVTFNPTTVGEYKGTVTLSTPNAIKAIVNLKGFSAQHFDVQISSIGLSTLYLDYPVKIPYEEYDPDVLGVYYIWDIGTASPGTELMAARLNDYIPARTAVIVHGNPNTDEIPFYRFPRIKEPEEPLNITNYLSGSLVDIDVADVIAETPGTVYTLGRGSDSYINFYRYVGNGPLKANKAYLLVENGSDAKSFKINFDGESTGIKTIDTIAEDGAWYTIEGIKQQGTPTRKGLYIHNGKTVVVK